MPPLESSDALTVVRCQLGDQDAWRQLVSRWHPRLWVFIVRMVPQQAVAEDVLQTVWLRVVRSIVQLRDPQRWSSWVYGITRATIADRFREQYRRPPVDQVDEILIFDSSSDRMDLTEFLDAGLERLHPSDREAVVLHYLEELPLAEVAEICGVPEGTIKSRLHRARVSLRKTLRD